MNPKDCKYFYRCSCNVCPLDKDKNLRTISELDKTKYCLAERNGTLNLTGTNTEAVTLWNEVK